MKNKTVRVIELIPQMQLGMSNGQPVSVIYTLPIEFQIREQYFSRTYLRKRSKQVAFFYGVTACERACLKKKPRTVHNKINNLRSRSIEVIFCVNTAFAKA
jgi:hypothetical protein